MDFVSDPDVANAVLDIPFHYHLRAAERLVRMGVDMIWIGDDVGAQNAMLVAPDTWRQFLKPMLARFISTLKAINPALKVAYHSDGYIYPIIPELMEIGVDILNPIQPKSMNPAKMKKDFGDKLCFWGSIDEQHTLPFGTPADVRAETLTRLSTIGKNGGLIIGPTHHVQLDTPIENVMAMVETVRSTPCA
jgi:uroporphyrinogen-III decarboxylase